jgi:hypothetical protein
MISAWRRPETGRVVFPATTHQAPLDCAPPHPLQHVFDRASKSIEMRFPPAPHGCAHNGLVGGSTSPDRPHE